jgi:hypothetical protein
VAAGSQKLAATKSNRQPIVTKIVGGIRIEDKDGYYRIVKTYAEATSVVQHLIAHRNSVMSMNGFESAKWRLK